MRFHREHPSPRECHQLARFRPYPDCKRPASRSTQDEDVKQKLSRLPLATKVILATPAAVLLVMLLLTAPLIGVPLVVIVLLVLRPELLNPGWWRALSAPRDE